jgi:hypothetical protein
MSCEKPFNSLLLDEGATINLKSQIRETWSIYTDIEEIFSIF